MEIQTMNDLQTALLNDKERFERLQSLESVPFCEYKAKNNHILTMIMDALMVNATGKNLANTVNQLLVLFNDANTLEGGDADKLDFFSSHVTGIIRDSMRAFAKTHSFLTPETRDLQEKTEYLASLNAKITGTFIAPEVWM